MTRPGAWPRAVLAVLFAAAAAVACSEDGPLQPDVQFNIETSSDVSRVAVYRAGSPSASASASAWIGAEGGTLRLMDFEIVVPPGAVTTLTRFRIKVPSDPKKLNRVIAEFEPHNTAFALPVTLRLPYRGTSAESHGTAIIWWSGSQWVRYPTIMSSDGRLETTTDHFSEFGTEDDPLVPGGIIPIGG